MKILICGRYLNAPIGGAEISTHILLKNLLSLGHKLAAFTISNNNLKRRDWPFQNDVLLYEGIFSKWFHKKLLPGELMNLLIENRMCKTLDKVCREFQPEIIINQSNFLLPNNYSKFKTIFFIRDYNFGSTLACSDFLRAMVNKPFLNLRRGKLRKFNIIITTSFFMQRVLKNFDIQSEVVYPFIDFSQYRINPELESTEKKYITFIRPTQQKGLEIAIKIIHRLPEKNFLIVGQLPEDFIDIVKNLNNLTYLPWQGNMREVYRKTRLLLVPSIWQEPFGRVPVEAGLNGIPSIASKRGGLIEAVGEGGILINDIWNIDKWLEAIKSMDDTYIYEQYSLKAKSNAEKFKLQTNLNKFTEIVQDKLGIIL